MNVDTAVLYGFWEAASPYRTALVMGAGAVAVLIGVVVLWRWWRHGHAHTRMGALAVALATGFAAEGMWEVATGSLHLAPHLAVGLFAFLEVVMVSQGLLARYKLRGGYGGAAVRHMHFVWVTAVASGLIAASAADNLTEFVLRLAAPSVAAGIWWTELTADAVVAAQPTSWIWTPRRIGIHLGLIRPGTEDLEVLDRGRRVQRMVKAAAAERAGTGPAARRAARRLDRLALSADADMVTEAAQRLQRALTIRAALLGPTPAPATQPPPPAVDARPVPPRAGTGPAAAKRQPSAADRVARAVARSPGASPAQIAARLKLSERTVQRHMPKPADDTAAAPTLKAA